MNTSMLKVLSFIGLALTIIPAFLVFFQKMSLSQNKMFMAVGTAIWFVTAPFWMKRKTN
ncbi:MAG TPA: hypothetical protein VFW11_01155 [Cyclobacteriaceae bacterium]|nr:hypothetical protein [Cyclobacteriaceae bacterium]